MSEWDKIKLGNQLRKYWLLKRRGESFLKRGSCQDGKFTAQAKKMLGVR